MLPGGAKVSAAHSAGGSNYGLKTHFLKKKTISSRLLTIFCLWKRDYPSLSLIQHHHLEFVHNLLHSILVAVEVLLLVVELFHRRLFLREQFHPKLRKNPQKYKYLPLYPFFTPPCSYFRAVTHILKHHYHLTSPHTRFITPASISEPASHP